MADYDIAVWNGSSAKPAAPEDYAIASNISCKGDHTDTLIELNPAIPAIQVRVDSVLNAHFWPKQLLLSYSEFDDDTTNPLVSHAKILTDNITATGDKGNATAIHAKASAGRRNARVQGLLATTELGAASGVDTEQVIDKAIPIVAFARVSGPNTDSGTAYVNEIQNVLIKAPDGDNFDDIYGLYVEPLAGIGEGEAWAVYAEGNTKSFFGNTVQIGADDVTSGTNVLLLADGTPPSTNIADSVQIYSDGGVLKYRKPDGSVVTVNAAASPVDQAIDTKLLNGGFNYFQRQAPGTATYRSNETYGPDRWVVLHNGGSSDVSVKQVTGDGNARFACQVKNHSGSTKKFALAQFLESDNSISLRGKDVRFQISAKGSVSADVRVAVIEWTGTADTLGSTRDLIYQWANSADGNPATSFFKTTNIIVRAHAQFTAGTSYTDLAVNATIGSSANNIALIVWTEDGVAQNVTLDLAKAGFYANTDEQVGWIQINDEYDQLARFYQKSYARSIAPGTVTTSDNGALIARAFDSDNLTGFRLERRMRVQPIVTIWDWLTGNSGYSTNFNNTTITVMGVSALQVSETGSMFLQKVGGFSSYWNTNTCYFGYHYTADAEL